MNQKSTALTIAPVFLAFFVMGFADIIGVAILYVKDQFSWTETQAGFLPSMVFLWFLILSIPSALFMNKIGRKNTVLISMLFTFTGMILPIIRFNEVTCYVTFGLLGIGNAILQVSVNPLLSNIVQGNRLTSSLTAGQFIKSLAAFTGPLLVGFVSLHFGNWELIFPVYAALAFISTLWIYFTPISKEIISQQTSSSVKKTVNLLRETNNQILFLGILCIVGLDVGMNITTPKILIERLDISMESAGYGASWYFAARTVGTFAGILFLATFPTRQFYLFNIIIALLALITLMFSHSYFLIVAMVIVIAFTCSCVFPILFAEALKRNPDKSNEISGLLITGVAGGAIFPPLMGIFSDLLGNQTGSLIIILICAIYLYVGGFSVLKKIEIN